MDPVVSTSRRNSNISPPNSNPYGIISGTYITWFDRYKGKILGEGVYGEVRKYENIKGNKVENKIVKIGKLIKYGLDASLLREAAFISKLNHPNVINLLDAFFTDKYFCIILPEANMDLYKRYRQFPKLTIEEIISISYQIIRGISYLHSQDVLHGDLKPYNILLFSDSENITKCIRATIADFGISRPNTCKKIIEKQQVFSLWYRPPEILLGGTYVAPGDIWALGCIIYEIVTERFLFPGKIEIDMLYKQFTLLGTPTEQTWPGVSILPLYVPTFPMWKGAPVKTGYKDFDSLLSTMLILDPSKRDNTITLMKHPIFDSLKSTINSGCLKAPDIVSINCNVSILENVVNVSNFKDNFYPASLRHRSTALSTLYKFQKDQLLDDSLISLTILIFDKVTLEIYESVFKQKSNIKLSYYLLLLGSCLYIVSAVLNIPINEDNILIMFGRDLEEEFININKRIVTILKLDLHISSPLNLLDVYVPVEIREASIVCLNIISYTSLSRRYPSEFIALLAMKIASDYLHKDYKYDKKLENFSFGPTGEELGNEGEERAEGSEEEAYDIIIKDLKETKIRDFSLLDRGIVSAKDIVNKFNSL